MSTSKPLLPRTTTVRIPLDYYQILGVAFDATSEQIQQSFEDRLQQLPKQQYSNFAIASRKKLLQEAHGILLNPKRRQEHDQGLFPELAPSLEDLSDATETADPNKGIDIDSNYLAGALILLLEFGEFDAVLDLGQEHLNRPIDLQKMPTESGPNDDDVALAVSIAHLELGRENSQQGDCEQAGQCLQAGLRLLRDEGKFLDIQAELKKDLSKLRPYRVLELLSLDLEDTRREDGFSMLQDMLDDRGGLEGSGDDQSGLSINDFLLFIQQLRDHLTVTEQFNLFKAESMRPSSVASYFSVYAHVAKGVAEYQPQLISHAKSLLSSLADRQDLNLEQGMCSLLLGQPDAAVYCVQQSTDEDALAYIDEYSEGAPDIIPGLYLYTDQWLQEEVYPYFRDLKDQDFSLEDYFNDPDVQGQLSELEPDLPNINESWNAEQVDAKWQQWLDEKASDTSSGETLPPELIDSGPEGASETQSMDDDESSNWFSALLPDKTKAKVDAAGLPLPQSQLSRFEASAETTLPPAAPVQSQPESYNADVKQAPTQVKQKGSSQKSQAKPAERSSKSTKAASKRRSPASANLAKKSWTIMAASLLLGVSVLWGIIAVGKWFQSPSPTTQNVEPPEPSNGEIENPRAVDPPSAIGQAPSPGSEDETQINNETSDDNEASADNEAIDKTALIADGELTTEQAQNIIRTWQTIKGGALGKDRQIDALKTILSEPALARWRYSAEISMDEGKYTTYTLSQLSVDSVTMDTSTSARIRAKIEENRDQYSAASTSPVASLEDVYEVDYRLELVEGEWRIREMDVLENGSD